MEPTHNKKCWRAYIKRNYLLIVYAIATFISFGLVVKKSVTQIYDGTAGPKMTTQTWPAGTFLANFPEGDRINTYHRNYLMMNGQAGTGVWDISNPTAPKRVQFSDAANNGHRWWKLEGDLFYREYSVPEVQGTGYKYLDLSNMLDRKPITASDILYTVRDGQSNYDNLETFPHTIDGSRVFDMRTGVQVDDIPATVSLPDVVVRVGNYVFYAPQTGEISAFDFGDPDDIKFLGSFGGDIPHEQYSTGIQLWRNYLVFMSGNQGPDALVGFDISDPTNIKKGFSLHSDQATLGRYMIFQDEYGFSGRFDRGVKFNFETMEIEQEFFPPSSDETLQFIDNQWMPIGHILVASGDDKTSIFAHQDGLDTKPPTVGHHFPVAGAINQPQTTTLGFVINETLDDLTLNDQTIQVRPLDGSPIKADVTTTSYQVINYAPKEALLPNTTYEVKFVDDGVKDAVGNGMEEYIFYFTTGGDTSNQSPEITGIDLSIPSPATINTTIHFTANATDPDGNSLRYRWDFGDGSPKTEWTDKTTSHMYTEAGNYKVQVQVSDNNGGFIVGSQSIVITSTIPSQLPTQSSPITVDSKNRIIWSVNPDNNSVTLVNADNLKVIKEVTVGLDPVNVAVDNIGNAWITCRDSDEIYVLKTNGGLVAKITLPRGSRPYGMVLTPDGSRGFVSAFGSGKLIEISLATNTIKQVIDLGATPRALAISGDGRTLLVTRFISEDAAGQVWKIDLNTFTLKNTIMLAVDDFTVDNGNEGRGLPNYVSGITIHPDNASAWSVAKKDNILRGLARDGKPLTFDNAVRTAVSSINSITNKEELAKRLDIDNHGQPSAALYSPTGNYLFVTMQGNNRMIVIDPKRGLELLKKDVGKAPQGLAIDTTTNRIFIKNFMDRSISVFDASDMIKTGSNTLKELATISTVNNEELSPVVLKGKQIFYDASDIRMGTDGYISCASCHIDGSQDGRTWDFTDRGEGFRNTISLIGRAGTGHGRVHWSANFDEIQDFENDIRFHFKGQGFMSDANFNKGTTALSLGDTKKGKSADLDALAAYITSLNRFEPSPYRNTNGSLTTDGQAGKSLFTDLKCASCHSGVNFTDSETGKMHDVGTITSNSGSRLGKKLRALDVPTLKDVWATAPYLHDGSAKTLAEVFTSYNMNHAHGATSTLSATQMKQLEAYLKQIDNSEEAPVSQQTLEMASPADGALIETGGPVNLGVDTNITGITKVEYYVDNSLVEEVATLPFETSWTPILWKTYTISAKVFYNDGKTASVTPEINVKYKNTIQVMFVVGDKNNLTFEDQRVKSRLEQKLGFAITLFSDEEATSPQSANPFDLVLVSSTVDPRELGNDLEAARVPLMTWNPFMYGKLRLTSGELNSGFGFTQEGYSKVTISNPTHPMAAAAGVSTALYSITQSLPFGDPTAEAIVIAKAGTLPILFGYEPSISMPSRRVAFPLRDQFMHLLTDQGLKMFDAAVLWTLHGGDADIPIGPLPDVFFESPLDGDLVNTPLEIKFKTEGWSIPSEHYKLRFKIDGQDRGLVTSNGILTDPTPLSEGSHELSLQMERSDNSLTDLGETITVVVTNDQLPQDPTVMIQSPTSGGLIGPDFEIKFSIFQWDIAPGGRHIKYFIDEVEKEPVFDVNPIQITNLTEGEHTIRMALANADGTLFGDPTEITIIVDERFSNIPDTPFSVEYRDNSSGVSTQELKPVFQIVSRANEPVPLTDFKIKYWFTPDSNASMASNIDYSAVSGAMTSFKTTGAQNYLEISFDTSSGNLSTNGKTGEIQTRLHSSGYQVLDQSNDFSYDPGKTTPAPHVLVTLYRNDDLVWGLEPTGGTPSVNRKPSASFSTDTTQGTAPLAINFDASDSIDPDGDTLTYHWDFGNGDTATGVTTSYIFNEPGDQNITLTVSDGNGKSDTAMTVIVILTPDIGLKANFSATPVSGTIPLLVNFDSSSSIFSIGSAINYFWDFGDGTTSDLANPSHTYTQSGSYAVSLRISDGIHSDTSKPVTLTAIESTVNVAPTADFTTNTVSGIAPLIVNFDASGSTDQDGDLLTYNWEFEDTSTGTGETISYTFTNPGEYIVTLTVNDGALDNTKTMLISVREETPPVSTTVFVEYRDGGNGTPSNNVINPHLQLVNSGNQDISYSDITIKYWFTSENSNALNFWCDWAQLGTDNVDGIFGEVMGMNYLEISFTTAAGVLTSKENSGPVQARFAKTNWSNFDEADDYSYDSTKASYTPHNKITVYNKGQLIWGVEPNENSTRNAIGALQISIFPNPVITELTLTGQYELKGATIEIVNLSGKVLYSRKVEQYSKDVRLSMTEFVSGVYFVKIKQHGRVVLKQVIKNNI